ncbi:hypothetical protein BB561_006463 [Smittium simulii]|uniref:Heat shock protein 70 n=1 Tax=Smittium simulii TaxID=133385 RepID=A0A2T9Y421_9FUNG|nr:hypothetical protein BB561_006463 [Smittium simulii]
MSVVGFDIGTLQSVIAVARNRGIDIITNEVSNRTTPSMVSFGPKQRYLGEMAKNLEMGNFKNTITSLKRIIGRSAENVIADESRFIGAKIVDVNGEAGVEVDFAGEKTKFSATQLYAMFLGRLRDTTAKELSNKVSDVVLSVPAWYTDRQRRSVLQACQIANLNCLRLINDYTAAALSYGITKSDLPEDKARNVVFVDMGYSSFTISIVAFKKGELVVKASTFSNNCGGRDLDLALYDHFAKLIAEKHKVDVNSNTKAKLRLFAGCEKLKKTLSANPVANLSVESLMNDIDVNYTIKREEFEELIAPVLARIREPIQKAIEISEVDVNDIYAIETVGGSIRVPAVKKTLTEVFGRDLSYTLNQDEAVARGCAFQCAILSPVFKVRDFAIRDITINPIEFVWEKTDEDDETNLAVYSANHTIPSTKILTFYRKNSFSVDAVYSDPQGLPTGTNKWILKFNVDGIKPHKKGDSSIVKVKSRIDLSGVIDISSAYVVEEKEIEETVPPKEGEQVNPDAEPVTRKVKRLVKSYDLIVNSSTQCMNAEAVNICHSEEVRMSNVDAEVTKTENIKNTLEEYIYDIRSKVESDYQKFVNPNEKGPFLESLMETEDWLYTEEGENADFSTYSQKIENLKAVGDLVIERAIEASNRPAASKQLRESIYHWAEIVSSSDSKYSHILSEEKDKILAFIDKTQTWLDEQTERQSKCPLYEAPILFAHQINKERENMIRFASTIMSKPKPMATTAESAPETASNTPNPEAGSQKNTKAETPADDVSEASSTNEMDVD